jgi:hypothetical protein
MEPGFILISLRGVSGHDLALIFGSALTLCMLIRHRVAVRRCLYSSRSSQRWPSTVYHWTFLSVEPLDRRGFV